MARRIDTDELTVALGGAMLIVGPLLAALGAALLLVGLFLDWFEPGLTAWTAFEALDLVLALAAFGGLVIALASLGVALAVSGDTIGRAGVRGLRQPALPALGGVALVVVASQLLNHPPTALERAPEAGAWISLAGAALLALGGALAVARFSVDTGARSPEGGAGAGPPEGGAAQGRRW